MQRTWRNTDSPPDDRHDEWLKIEHKYIALWCSIQRSANSMTQQQDTETGRSRGHTYNDKWPKNRTRPSLSPHENDAMIKSTTDRHPRRHHTSARMTQKLFLEGHFNNANRHTFNDEWSNKFETGPRTIEREVGSSNPVSDSGKYHRMHTSMNNMASLQPHWKNKEQQNRLASLHSIARHQFSQHTAQRHKNDAMIKNTTTGNRTSRMTQKLFLEHDHNANTCMYKCEHLYI